LWNSIWGGGDLGFEVTFQPKIFTLNGGAQPGMAQKKKGTSSHGKGNVKPDEILKKCTSRHSFKGRRNRTRGRGKTQKETLGGVEKAEKRPGGGNDRKKVGLKVLFLVFLHLLKDPVCRRKRVVKCGPGENVLPGG